MSKKKKTILISILAVALVAIIILVVVMVTKNGKKDKSIDIGSAGNEEEEQSYWRTDSHGVAKAETGYYYLEWNDDNFTTTLKYFDDSTHKTTPVCAKAECMHNSSDCNAVLGSDYLSSLVHYYKGSIYVVRVENGLAKQVRIEKDGSNRQDVAALFANDTTTSVSLVFHDDCAYAYNHIGHTGAVDSSENDTETIVKVELSTGKTSEAFSYKGAYNAIYGARSFGTKMFFQIFNCSIDKQTAKADISYKLYCYDYETGESEKVSDDNISDYYVDTENNVLYYYVISKGLYSRKLSESKAELLYKADDTITTATISYDGKYIYMYNGGIGSLTNLREKITPVIYVLEPSGNVVNTIELDSKKIRNMFYGDEKYLFFAYGNKLAYIDKSSISGEFKIVTVD